ncbi:MAG: TetR/AcrR family transcriptional regulator, partial [Catalinimonas sp.]
QSIQMIEEMGFEQFTFKKLATRISSTEASVYRYFDNKHRLLVYLVSWYWTWVEYLIDYQTHNINDPAQQLRIAVRVLVDAGKDDPASIHINEGLLHRIVIAESPKLYLTKQVDEINREGAFRAYKSLCHRLALLAQAYAPGFRYPHALWSTLVEASHAQLFFSQHLPSLTEVRADHDNSEELIEYLNEVLFRALAPDAS